MEKCYYDFIRMSTSKIVTLRIHAEGFMRTATAAIRARVAEFAGE
jgi:hypothetical protein